MLRYVVLHHTGIESPHYDLMIEREPGGALMTWRCADWPVVAGDEITRLRDHRRFYLDFEGSVSGDRGFVARIRDGDCQWTGDASQLTVQLPSPIPS